MTKESCVGRLACIVSLHYPPCMARMISTWSPSASGVDAQASRRTTAPLSAMANPFGLGSASSAVSSRHSSARSRHAITRSSPLTLSRMGVLPGLKGWRKAFEAEAPGGARHVARRDEVVDRVRGDRREQDAVAVMAGREHEAADAGRPEDRRVVVRGRPETGPYRLELHVLDRGQRPPRAV